MPFQQRYDQEINLMVCTGVRVNRTRTPQEMLDATGRYVKIMCAEGYDLNEMSRGEGEEVTIYFFNTPRTMSFEEILQECDQKGLVPADPYSLAALNEEDPEYAYIAPNLTFWKSADGWWRTLEFMVKAGRGKSVFVSKSTGAREDRDIACFRKKDSSMLESNSIVASTQESQEDDEAIERYKEAIVKDWNDKWEEK